MGIESDINLLTTVAIKEIKDAFKAGDGLLYGRLGEKYGPLAHRVYMNLEAPSKSADWGFYDNPHKSVLLDPWAVINRSEDLMSEGKNSKPNSPEFWNHPDMIKALIEYLSLATVG